MPPSDIVKKPHSAHFNQKVEIPPIFFRCVGIFRLSGKVMRDALVAIDADSAGLDRFRHDGAERRSFLRKFRTLGHRWAITYGVPFAKADSASCHGGRKRTNIDSKTNGRTSTQPAANKPSLAKIGG